MKRPTRMQLQSDETEKVIKQCQDQIIYDKRLHLKDGSEIDGLYTVEGKKQERAKKFFMPNETHPFDHLIVMVKLRLPRRKNVIQADVKHLKPEVQADLISSSSSDRSSKNNEGSRGGRCDLVHTEARLRYHEGSDIGMMYD